MRKLYEIAGDILLEWSKPYFGAVPYIRALREMGGGGDMYGMDSSDDIILRFFANATSFRGPRARVLKYELAEHLSPAYRKDALKKYAPK